VLVDAATAVVLRAHLDGTLAVPGEKAIAPAQLHVVLDERIRTWASPSRSSPGALPDADKPEGIADALDRFGIQRKAGADAGVTPRWTKTPPDRPGPARVFRSSRPLLLEKLISPDRPVRCRNAAVPERLLWTPVQRWDTGRGAMERTPKKQAGAVTEALRTQDRVLAPDEERALRMLRGVGVRADAPLARIAPEGSALADELLLLELQLARQAWPVCRACPRRRSRRSSAPSAADAEPGRAAPSPLLRRPPGAGAEPGRAAPSPLLRRPPGAGG
jgi:hypothetical protein